MKTTLTIAAILFVAPFAEAGEPPAMKVPVAPPQMPVAQRRATPPAMPPASPGTSSNPGVVVVPAGAWHQTSQHGVIWVPTGSMLAYPDGKPYPSVIVSGPGVTVVSPTYRFPAGNSCPDGKCPLQR